MNSVPVNDFVLINSSKRAVIAIIHSVVFLAIASASVMHASRTPAIGNLRGTALLGATILATIFGVVSVLLVFLFSKSHCISERLYFAFCAASASLGLVRTVLGSSFVYGGAHLRVLALSLALITGFVILRTHQTAE